jgi:hypothetical protein
MLTKSSNLNKKNKRGAKQDQNEGIKSLTLEQ